MKAKSGTIALLFLLPVFGGCDLFSTRAPEEPSAGSTSFITPSSPDIVLVNLSTAIRELNENNYLRCLSAPGFDSLGNEALFSFEPASEAAQRFASQFLEWTLNSERKAFVSLSSAIPDQTIPSLAFATPLNQFEIFSPDSVVYISDYTFVPGHNLDSEQSSYAGKMTLTISRLDNSTWAISRWVDQATENPEPDIETWSTLKAIFAD